VVPELQRRRLFRTEYPDRPTFREFFGLPRPANQFLAGTLPAAAHPDTDVPAGTVPVSPAAAGYDEPAGIAGPSFPGGPVEPVGSAAGPAKAAG